MGRYTIREASKHSGLAESTVRRLVKTGKIQADKVEGIYRIPIESLSEYLTESGHKVKKSEPPKSTHEELESSTLYKEMKGQVEFLKEQVAQCQEEARYHRERYQELVNRLTVRALPGSGDPRGIFTKIKDFFVGKSEEEKREKNKK